MTYEPKAEMIADLRILTGASDDQLEALTLALKISGTKVLNEIRQEHLPIMLEGIVVEIAADSYHLNRQASSDGGVGEITGSVSSVSDNGQSVSYRDSSYHDVLKSVSSALRNYTAQIDRFRKSGW